ncbi:hypothetical protein ASCCphi28_gp04 [Lactococcus phage asccphi28]|uniref:hypothetical protein n=1 Tax=Lactococcus phage asccphi28 TaxID=503388 RepID=UPI000165F85F|nr:hypothetical protein ASCCphi28_gp04 [Lactococcus phage asccphi28]ACA21478.1 unknown [Lactococcus phage asccphi28]
MGELYKLKEESDFNNLGIDWNPNKHVQFVKGTFDGEKSEIKAIENYYSLSQVIEIATYAYSQGVEQGLEIDFPMPSDTANFVKYIKTYIEKEY